MSAPAPQREPLPSVIELGRSLAAIDAEYWRLDDDLAERSNHENARSALDRQADALRALIATRPAETMMDAAVQVAAACDYAALLEGSDWRSPSSHQHMEELHERIYRLLISALPFVAKAAGLRLEEMGWEDVLRMRAIEFGGEAPA